MNKNFNLGFGILALLVFVSYLYEPGPMEFFGNQVSVWFFRAIWFFVAVVQLASYYRKLKAPEN